jgi:sporulation protein YlmC with PRC-barrel domain
VNKENRDIAVNLTKKQIENSPPLNTDKPVSRQYETSYYGYYGWAPYWGGPFMWGAYSNPSMMGAYPSVVRDRVRARESARDENASWDLHLRSTRAVSGYHIQAADGEIGHVEDFVIDDETWAIRYLVVNTRNWWPGKKILVSPKWFERVSWGESKVFVNLSRDTIQQSPDYTEESLLTREYEVGLHQHYQHKGYWVDEPSEKVLSR